MGVSFRAEGTPIPYENTYDCGYMTLLAYRTALASAASPIMGQVYKQVSLGTYETAPRARGEVMVFDLSECPVDAGEIRQFADTHEGVTSDAGASSLSMTLDALNAAMHEAYGPDLSSFLCAPDTEGRLSASECAGILSDLGRIGPVDVDVRGHNYGTTEMSVGEDGRRSVRLHEYNMHEQFVGMFQHCADSGSNLVWG